MTTMNRALAVAIKADINAALAIIGAKHGVAINTAGGRFDPASGTANLKVLVACPATGSNEGASASHVQAANDFANYASMFGLNKETLGRTFSYKDHVTKVIGLMPNRHKYPILCEQAGRKPFLLTVETLKAYLPGA